MIILGIGAPFGHDPAAAILVDGKLIAAVEEERFTRVKHAPGAPAVNAIRYCLQVAGLQPSQIDHVAFPGRSPPTTGSNGRTPRATGATVRTGR